MKVHESLGTSKDSGPHATATVACFLVQEGADMSLHNNQGLSPVEVCSPEVAAIVMTFKDSLATKTYPRFSVILLSLKFIVLFSGGQSFMVHCVLLLYLQHKHHSPMTR